MLDAIRRERRRSERSGRPFLLMLISLQDRSENGKGKAARQRLVRLIGTLVRETDVVGWYRENEIVGVILTELGNPDKNVVLQSLKRRAEHAIGDKSLGSTPPAIKATFHFFPGDSEPNSCSADLNLYPELSRDALPQKFGRAIKRTIDVLGSVLALILFSGLLLVIATLVKLSSKGPVLFRQVRIGQYGKPFTFLKFRSMYVNSDAAIHRDYVTRFIAGQTEPSGPDDGPGVYKITNDPRITPLGSFLRKTSLDELPQLWNVLRGEMSLVGPRPPLPYEFQHYGLWHRRRVVEIKPGITGLWQVSGRSRTSFDDMVRLDLQYGNEWCLWLDLKILLQTPIAVLFGDGAY